MKVGSWLSTSCSTAACTTISAANMPPLSDTTTSTFSDTQTHSSSSASIQCSLSLLTLPSVPSLQKITFSPENFSTPSSAAVTPLTTLKPNRTCHINFLAIHNNLMYAASGNEINVYETITHTLFTKFKTGSTGSVKSISFSDGQIFTAHQDCKIRIWKLSLDKQHKLIATLPTIEDRLKRFIFPQNYVTVRRHRKKLWIVHHDAVSGLASNGNFVSSVSWDRSLKIWQADNSKCLQSINKAHDDAINAIVLSKDGSIYTGSADKRIKVWKKEESNKKYGLIATLEKHKSAVNALALTTDGSVLFSGSCDRSILVWEREDSANYMVVAGALRGHKKAILCLINVQDLLLSGSADRTVRIWERRVDGRYCCLTMLNRHQTPVRSLAAVKTEDGGGVKVFSGSFDGEIKVWQIEMGNRRNYGKNINHY